METDRLTQIIEAEVKKTLAELGSADNPPQQVRRREELRGTKQTNLSGINSETPKIDDERQKILAVFTAGCACQNNAIKQVKKMVAGGCDVTIALSPMAVGLLAIERIESIPKIGAVLKNGYAAETKHIVGESEVIVIPLLSRTAAAKLALGIADDPALMLVMSGLISGKPVIAARNAADPDGVDCPLLATERTPPALTQLAKNYLKTLAEFGMTLVDITSLADAAMGTSTIHSPIADKNGTPLINQAVITMLAGDVKEFIIHNPAIVTPLAYDLAKERGIKLITVKSQ